ncbi:aldehyde dehydrogenase (NADP(+)) [Nocardia sp. NPDC057440]|uniref:aldehyde dehydrogenase (NADP(+)) n=1 Tax=Nocardia sp. NPDC057440 TaxID=3346134 RepID=UPI003672F14F
MMYDTSTDRIDHIVLGAQRAATQWSSRTRTERAAVLRAVADRLDGAADILVPLAIRETHLTEQRLRGELARTTFQLRLFAETVNEGGYLDARVDHADPDWSMGPRPDLRRTRVPYGPVVVFAASNFPFAFSVAGGDTASALAAGCSVIVKAHPGHVGLSAATAQVLTEAFDELGAPSGLLQIVYGQEAGVVVLTHPQVRAAAFTGSIPGGRALFDLASSRPEPIPFYGELGSVNPVFVTASADADRGVDIAAGLVGSFTLSAGQFCTKPGVVLAPGDSHLLASLRAGALPSAAPLLNDKITAGYLSGQQHLRRHPAVTVVAEGEDPLNDPPAPTVLSTSVQDLLADPEALLAECFGPTVLIVEYADEQQLVEVAEQLEGQLTATLVANEDDRIVGQLTTILASKAGRLLWNQWPTGVSVTYAQQHGGPYPATTAAGTTSVGTAAIDRFTRPVAYQGFPDFLLPGELRDDADVPRRVDGKLT